MRKKNEDQEAVDALFHTRLDLQQRKREGMLNESDVHKVWDRYDLSPELQQSLLTLFEEYDLVYRIKPTKQKVLYFCEPKEFGKAKEELPQPSNENSNLNEIEKRRRDFFSKHPTLKRQPTLVVRTAYRNQGSFEREMEIKTMENEKRTTLKRSNLNSSTKHEHEDELIVTESAINNAANNNDAFSHCEVISVGLEEAKFLIPQWLPPTIDPIRLSQAGWLPSAALLSSGPQLGTHKRASRHAYLALCEKCRTGLMERYYIFNPVLPTGLFARFLIRLLDVVVIPVYWRSGLFASKGSERALVQTCIEKHAIKIKVYGKQPTLMWRILESHLKGVVQHWYQMQPHVVVPCTHCLSIPARNTDPYIFSFSECEQAISIGRSSLLCKHPQNEGEIQVYLGQLVPDMALSGLSTHEIEYSKLTLHKAIARGSHSVIHKASYDGTLVAVKEFSMPTEQEAALSLSSDEDSDIRRALNEFRDEALLMSGLSDHPNLVKLRGICKKPLAVVMEYVSGGNLFDFLKQNPNLSWSQRLNIALDIARGMDFLHSTSPPIIHRDLKSLNILMEGSRAKVADFGLSTLFSITTSGREVDNPRWLAPEVMRGEEYTEKADIYSFGIILWELHSQQQPFSEFGITFFSLLEEKIKGGLRPTIHNEVDDVRTAQSAECPTAYANLIRDCWSGEPEKRPPFIKAIRTLNHLLEKLNTSDPGSCASEI
jgi:tRNA A-37 threonylcarbamoyl transferase component Bud32